MSVLVLFMVNLLGVPQIDSWEPLYTYNGDNWGMSVTAYDVNEDGLCDLIFAGEKNCAEYMVNTGNGFTEGPTFMADGIELTVPTC